MEITARGLWTLVHGMGFGALYLLACSGALVELYRFTMPDRPGHFSENRSGFLRGYMLAMVVLAWLAVLSGAYVIYPWYRAVAPAGTVDLAGYPQLYLRAHPEMVGWHTLGMEWKEHVAWLTPIAITMAAAVFIRYGRELRSHRGLRQAVVGFTAVSFFAAGVAGFFGAMINKTAPTQGGDTIRIMGEVAR